MALTSETATQPQLYDVAESILAQKIQQIAGIGQVNLGGSSRPGVRAEINPLQLSKLGVGLDQVAAALNAANAHSPKGQLSEQRTTATCINDNDQLFLAKEYAPLIVAYHNGAPVRLSDVATVVDSQENIRNAGSVNGAALGHSPVIPPAAGQHYRYRGPRPRAFAGAASLDSAVDPHLSDPGSHHDHSRFGCTMSSSPW